MIMFSKRVSQCTVSSSTLKCVPMYRILCTWPIVFLTLSLNPLHGNTYQSTPVSSPCRAACQCTGRNSTLPPLSPTWGACDTNRCVFNISWATSRKSSTRNNTQREREREREREDWRGKIADELSADSENFRPYFRSILRLTTVDQAPEAEVMMSTNAMNNKHKMINARLLT